MSTPQIGTVSLPNSEASSMIEIIDARIANIKANPGVYEAAEQRLDELNLIRAYASNMLRGQQMVYRGMGLEGV